MKKHVMIAAGLAVLSTSAFASKARMEALGQGTGGSLYLEDTRRIFVNPAHLNNLKNYVVTEWGEAGAADSTNAPNAEGGFFREMGNFAYGLYVGNTEDAQNSIRKASATGYGGRTTLDLGNAATLKQTDSLDFFFAGDMGVQWGARLHYAKNSSETTGDPSAANNFEKSQSAFGLGLGITMGALDVYTNLDLTDKSEGGVAKADKFEADLGLNLGASYTFGGMTAFVDYSKVGAEYAEFQSATSTFTDMTEQTTIAVGVAKIHEVSSTAVVVFDMRYAMISGEDKDQTSATVTNTYEMDEKKLALTVAFETDATSWLTLRGSVSQNLPVLSAIETKSNVGGTASATVKKTDSDTTSVNAGATLSFGKLKVDGTIGTTGVSRAGTASASNGVLSLDNLMTRVGVHYWF